MDISSDDDTPKRVSYKIAIVGDGTVGKSSICNRFCKDFFAELYKQTIGIDFFSQTVTIPDGTDVTFNLFDIGGQSVGSKMLKTYIAGSQCVLYVFDLTNQESLLNLREWHKQVSKDIHSKPLNVIIGNKSDLTTQRQVVESDINKMKEHLGAKNVFQVSALNGDRVKMTFNAVAGYLTGKDLGKFVLEERNVVQVVVKQQLPDQLSMNQKAAKEKAYQDIETTYKPDAQLSVDDKKKLGTGNIHSPINDELPQKKKKKGICSAM